MNNYATHAARTYANVVSSLDLQDAPRNFRIAETSIFEAGGTQCGNTITLNSSTPINDIELVLKHEFSHWLIGKNWLFTDDSMHGSYFLAMQMKVHGGTNNYLNDRASGIDSQQAGWHTHYLYQAQSIFTDIDKDNTLSVESFAKALTVHARKAKQKTIKYKVNAAAAITTYAAIAAFVGAWFLRLI